MALHYSDNFNAATIGSGLGDNYLTGVSYTGSGAGDAVLGYGNTGAAIYNLQGVYARTVTSIAAGTGIVVGMRVKVDSGTGDQLGFQLENASAIHITLYVDRTNRRFKVYKGTSGGTLLFTGPSAAFEFATWFYLELKVEVHDTLGYVEVRVDTVPQGTILAEGDTKNHADGAVTSIGFQFPNCYIDDFYCLDDTGDAPLNDFLGDEESEGSENGVNVEFSEPVGVRTRFTMSYNGRAGIVAQNLYPR